MLRQPLNDRFRGVRLLCSLSMVSTARQLGIAHWEYGSVSDSPSLLHPEFMSNPAALDDEMAKRNNGKEMRIMFLFKHIVNLEIIHHHHCAGGHTVVNVAAGKLQREEHPELFCSDDEVRHIVPVVQEALLALRGLYEHTGSPADVEMVSQRLQQWTESIALRRGLLMPLMPVANANHQLLELELTSRGSAAITGYGGQALRLQRNVMCEEETASISNPAMKSKSTLLSRRVCDLAFHYARETCSDVRYLVGYHRESVRRKQQSGQHANEPLAVVHSESLGFDMQ